MFAAFNITRTRVSDGGLGASTNFEPASKLRLVPVGIRRHHQSRTEGLRMWPEETLYTPGGKITTLRLAFPALIAF
ncbi:hypothetical protein D3C71_1010410 [compost metagenome]